MGLPKLLLQWRATTVIGHLISEWTALGANQIAVVHAANDRPMETELDRLGFPLENRIVNPDADSGMFSSVRCAANWRGWDESTTHRAITLGDQPHVRRETLAALIDYAKRNPDKICQPGRGARGMHPIILPQEFFEKLSGSKSETLKDFLVSMPDEVKLMETNDAGLDLDIDFPADYERAKQLDAAANIVRRQVD